MDSHKESYSENRDDSLNMNNDIGKVKQLFILGIDCTKFGPTARYIMLAASLFLFTCGYGYYQEWVVYSWFKRKLGLFFFSIMLAFILKFFIWRLKPLATGAVFSYIVKSYGNSINKL